MKLKRMIARSITNLSVKVAIKAAGQVSTFGTYQPKEPAALKKQTKKG